jgi:predicted Ser/Thr protein kinase
MFISGSSIDNRYRLDAPIAAGGMGQVWRAVDAVLGRTVAVKVLRDLNDEAARARFRNEARAMAALRHPGVAPVYDYGETASPDGAPVAYIVMACVEGQSLSQRIAEAGRLSTAETSSIIAEAADAVQAVHDAGVVHRDVKPANLIIEPDGHVVVIDFGVAVAAGGSGVTGQHEIVGTALYMAPEQVTRQPLTPATDIYALGAVAYHCLAGHPPFLGDDAVTVALRHLDDEPPPLPENVPPSMRSLVATAMAKDPLRRYPAAAAMAAAAAAMTSDADAMADEAAAVVAVGDPDGTALLAGGTAVPPPRTTPGRSRTPLRAIAGALTGLLAALAILAFADPTDTFRLPGDQPRPPAVTTDPDVGTSGEQPIGTPAELVGGAGGDWRPGTVTLGPANRPGAGPAGAGPGPSAGSDSGSSPGNDPAEPEPTPPPDVPEPTTPAEPEPTQSPDGPAPTDEPSTSPSPDETAAETIESSPSPAG